MLVICSELKVWLSQLLLLEWMFLSRFLVIVSIFAGNHYFPSWESYQLTNYCTVTTMSNNVPCHNATHPFCSCHANCCELSTPPFYCLESFSSKFWTFMTHLFTSCYSVISLLVAYYSINIVLDTNSSQKWAIFTFLKRLVHYSLSSRALFRSTSNMQTAQDRMWIS